MAISLKITGECIDPKCGHTFQFVQDPEGGTAYKATCGGCGAEYAGTAQADVTPVEPPPEAEPAAAKTTTAKASSTTSAGATT